MLQQVQKGEMAVGETDVAAIDFQKWKLFDNNGRELATVWRRDENVWLWGAPRLPIDSNSNQVSQSISAHLEHFYHQFLAGLIVK